MRQRGRGYDRGHHWQYAITLPAMRIILMVWPRARQSPCADGGLGQSPDADLGPHTRAQSRARPVTGRWRAARPRLAAIQQQVDLIGIFRIGLILTSGEDRKAPIDTLRALPTMRI